MPGTGKWGRCVPIAVAICTSVAAADRNGTHVPKVVPPLPIVTTVLNAAGYEAVIAPGSWVMIQGENLANTTRMWRNSDFNGDDLPTQIDGVSATIDGLPAFIEYVSPTQINVQAPSDNNIGLLTVVVANNGVSSPPVYVQMQQFSPALFTVGNYAIASVVPGNMPVTAATPAKPGDLVALLATGFGPTIPSVPAGLVVSGAPITTTPPVVWIDGLPVHVDSAILVAGTAGVYQITIRIPDTAPIGAVSVTATLGGAITQPGAVLYVGAP